MQISVPLWFFHNYPSVAEIVLSGARIEPAQLSPTFLLYHIPYPFVKR